MDSSISTRRLDRGIARVASRLRTSRSCVVVVRNRTPICWVFDALTIRCGHIGEPPPATIAPWTAAVFSAESVALRLGAGCDGTVRYHGAACDARLAVSYNVPYAGWADADLVIQAGAPVAVDRTPRRTGDETVVFHFQLTSASDPLHPSIENGASTRP